MVARSRGPATRLVDFALERESIRQRREWGKLPPWTADPILKTYRFCNVRRRDDRVSRWLWQHVYAYSLADVPELAQLQFVALCRWVNWPPTIAAIQEAGLWPAERPDMRRVGRLIDERRASGTKTWTGAYMVRAEPGWPGGKGRFVAEEVVGRALRRAWPEVQFMLRTDMRRPVWRVLCDCLHWGSFMAGQVVDDLTWTPMLRAPRDDYTWAPMGPGSVRGLNRVLGQPLGTRHSELDWCEHLVELRERLVDALGRDYRDLTLHDCQNVCCEYDKYERVRRGEGRPRSYYRPEEAY